MSLNDLQVFQQSITRISALSPENLMLLTEQASGQVLAKGEPLLRAGAVCQAYYFVEAGYLRTFYNKEGVDINIRFSLEGAFTTNLKSLKTGQPSLFTIEAGEKTTVWVVNRAVLSDLCELSPEIVLFTRRLLSNIVINMEEHSNLFKIYTPEERYRYLEQHEPRLLQRVSLSQLASYLGVTRETLSRIRKKTN